jgi:hypothetical protein
MMIAARWGLAALAVPALSDLPGLVGIGNEPHGLGTFAVQLKYSGVGRCVRQLRPGCGAGTAVAPDTSARTCKRWND